MTPHEKSQPHSVFLEAGKSAYHILVLQQFNPYTEEPFRSLWDKGYKKAKMQHEESFVRAGRIAYASGLALNENPNKIPNQRALWERGYKLATAASARQAAIARGEYVPPVRRSFVKSQTKLTRDFKQTVSNRAQRDPAFRRALEKERTAVSIPNKTYRTGTIGDYVAGTIRKAD